MSTSSARTWQPTGIDDLEPAAWTALKHNGSACVTAGPGAGKTEFLAQRAAYLFDTAKCARSQRILAISFKTDAASNLRRRVQQRAPDHAHRFASMTFDAFTKGLADRFRAALPPFWQMNAGYEVDLTIGKDRNVADFLDQLAARGGPHASGVAGIARRTFLPESLGRTRLSAQPPPPSDAETYAVMSWWNKYYINQRPQRVDFTMFNRLAELLVRTNPGVARALRLTFPFVFVDEFQDTTFAQYDFLRAVFGTGTAITAVGDNKQRIMGWAGAMNNAFDEFESDLGAKRFRLRMNHRSSPELVAIQHVIATAIDGTTTAVTSGTKRTITDATARIWRFPSAIKEASHISDWIADDIAKSGRSPSAYALLTRQTPDQYYDHFSAHLGAHGITLRNDAQRVGAMALQDLLVDDLCQLVIGVTRLASTRRHPLLWSSTCKTLALIRGVTLDDDNIREVADDLARIIQELRQWVKVNPPGRRVSKAMVDRILTDIGPDAIKRAFVAYRNNDAFDLSHDALLRRFAECADIAANWTDVCDRFEGSHAVPLMTVHKSKGLEYHTVIFLGIDDKQWWAHSPGEPDGLATFFVGLSRAAQRAIFTYCDAQGGRDKVRDFYDLLRAAGVVETSP